MPRKIQQRAGSSRNGSKSGIRIVARAKLPTRFGPFEILGIEGKHDNESAVALIHGKIRSQTPLVRIHSQCLTGDVLASERCDCRAQLELSLRRIAAAPAGILLYLPQEGRGIGLMNKLRAYELQDRGMDTVEANEELGFAADSRDYGFSAEALRLLGVRKVRLLSNNPDKVRQLENSGVRVSERVPCRPRTSRTSRAYMETKRTKLGHLLDRL
ncbi:MAG TPA: GTP cyclohydrolase II [Candidatus Sulfotelmatobacter sp.]|jgi:GTP cyclohydrolase II|nr:GTP cyclohydrolase II [Candidatus Sulfotelmatobacter sp.]